MPGAVNDSRQNPSGEDLVGTSGSRGSISGMKKLLPVDHDQLMQSLKFMSSGSFRNSHPTETFSHQILHSDVDPFVLIHFI